MPLKNAKEFSYSIREFFRAEGLKGLKAGGRTYGMGKQAFLGSLYNPAYVIPFRLDSTDNDRLDVDLFERKPDGRLRKRTSTLTPNTHHPTSQLKDDGTVQYYINMPGTFIAKVEVAPGE